MASLPETIADAAANAYDFLFDGDGLLDSRHLRTRVIHESPQNAVHRYLPDRATTRQPVLLVPPLAAPARCFDLRRGCSVAEHLSMRGHPTYVVDYGPIAFDDRALGLEHWIEDVLPAAVGVASDHAAEPLHVVGWCLGGILALLTAASHELPIRSLSLVASPFDFRQMRIAEPLRRLAPLTGGQLTTTLYRMLGGVPAPLTTAAFMATSIDRYLTRPLAVARHITDREWLAHLKATDKYMAGMFAYPGRSFGQLFHRFFLVNDLADGRLELSDATIDLADVKQPVLAVAGEQDVLAPRGAVLAVGELLSNAREVGLHVAPGGHLGVLTGRTAMTSTWPLIDDFIARHGEAA